MSSVDDDIRQQLARIEAKLDALLVALAEDHDDDRPRFDLDGEPIPLVQDQHDTL